MPGEKETGCAYAGKFFQLGSDELTPAPLRVDYLSYFVMETLDGDRTVPMLVP